MPQVEVCQSAGEELRWVIVVFESEKGKEDQGKEDIDERFRAIYDELYRRASAISRSMPFVTLNPTALVNEVYVKLAASKEFSSTSALHFKRIAAQAMKQVLFDAARRRWAAKRGGDNAVRIPLAEQLEQKTFSVEKIVILNDLLERLRSLNARQATVVEYRFYGGFSDDEISTELGVSKPTVERDWRAARAWLQSQLKEEA